MNYQMQHDIYSLGVVLLKIGLWTSFILYDTSPAGKPSTKSISRTPSAILDPQHLERSRNPLSVSTENKEKLEELAQTKLLVLLGKRYSDIVLQCLQCLDPPSYQEDDEDEKGHGSGAANWTDEDRVVIGVRYIENVLEKMLEITI